jgi:heme oxygenase (biliverdin-IX-beta and delta-forming)
MIAEPFLEELRSKTNSKHKLLEQTPISKAIISPHLTLNEYKTYLQKVLCLHETAEKMVFPLVTPLIDDLRDRVKSDKILLDMKILGVQPENHQHAFIDSRFIPTASFCMGMMYVLEGSTLGGIYILRNVMASIGKDGGVSANFLNCYEEFTGSKWKKFLELLIAHQHKVDDKGAAEIIDGAVYGFDRTYEIFNAQ